MVFMVSSGVLRSSGQVKPEVWVCPISAL